MEENSDGDSWDPAERKMRFGRKEHKISRAGECSGRGREGKTMGEGWRGGRGEEGQRNGRRWRRKRDGERGRGKRDRGMEEGGE